MTILTTLQQAREALAPFVRYGQTKRGTEYPWLLEKDFERAIEALAAIDAELRKEGDANAPEIPRDGDTTRARVKPGPRLAARFDYVRGAVADRVAIGYEANLIEICDAILNALRATRDADPSKAEIEAAVKALDGMTVNSYTTNRDYAMIVLRAARKARGA